MSECITKISLWLNRIFDLDEESDESDGSEKFER